MHVGDCEYSLLPLVDVVDFNNCGGHEYEFYMRGMVHPSARFFIIFLFSAILRTSSEILILLSFCISNGLPNILHLL